MFCEGDGGEISSPSAHFIALRRLSVAYSSIEYFCYLGHPYFLPLINSAPVLVWVSAPPPQGPSASMQAKLLSNPGSYIWLV